jgi:hypothetical protein
VSALPWWAWLLIGLTGGAALIAIPVLLWLRSFLRALDEATGWGGFRHRR